jgi:hypothetical protein
VLSAPGVVFTRPTGPRGLYLGRRAVRLTEDEYDAPFDDDNPF